MSVAFVFPGQGSQVIGMGKALAARYPIALRVFEEADDVLSENLSKLCFEGPGETLELTENSQPAILTVSIAVLRVLEAETSLRPDFVAGHSLGEYSALVCSGALTFADAVRVTRLRGRFMQQAVPKGEGAMVAVVGMERAELEEVCRTAAEGRILAPANFNGAGQIVLSGHADAIDRVVGRIEQLGKTAIRLKVSAPFHCQLMKPAAEALGEELKKLALGALRYPVVGNVNAEPYEDPATVVELLVRQVCAPVRWAEIVDRLQQVGVREVYELGHGSALTNMIRRQNKSLAAKAVQTQADIEGLAKLFAKPATTHAATSEPKSPVKAAETDWTSMTNEEREKKLGSLLTFDSVARRFDVGKPNEIYMWISVAQMPTWLVGGELRFDEPDIEDWLVTWGGIAKVRAHISQVMTPAEDMKRQVEFK